MCFSKEIVGFTWEVEVSYEDTWRLPERRFGGMLVVRVDIFSDAVGSCGELGGQILWYIGQMHTLEIVSR